MVDRLKNAVGAFVFVIKGNFMHLKTLFETNKNGKKGKGNKIGIGRKCEYVIKKKNTNFCPIKRRPVW